MSAWKSSAKWQGDLKGGGTINIGEAVMSDYSFSSQVGEGVGTNPQELIGAAHAACLAIELSNNLAAEGTPADSVKAEAGVQVGLIDGAPSISQINLDVVGSVPGLEESTFIEKAKAAAYGCPISRALAGVSEITVNAKLVQPAAAV
jgi:osmotically inducible protein OsmC